MTYDLCKLVIDKKLYVAAEMLEKLDLFYLRNRITQEQYEELTGMIED
jgi:hypothetical protein